MNTVTLYNVMTLSINLVFSFLTVRHINIYIYIYIYIINSHIKLFKNRTIWSLQPVHVNDISLIIRNYINEAPSKSDSF